MSKFFTADLHLDHANIIKFCSRPFDSKYEMNKTIINNWNDRITDNDDVYIGGDLALTSIQRLKHFLEILKGKKYFIVGDHDKQIWQCRDMFEKISQRMEIEIDGNTTIIDHYCYRVWRKSHYNSWHLYAHSHGRLPPIGKSWDIGVDNNNFTPLSEDEIIEIMKERPDNPNLIKKKK